MTSKNKISEQILRILSGGSISSDAQITLQELSIAVTQEFARAVKINYFQGRQEGVTELNGSYIYSFLEAIKEDTVLGLFYSDLPSTFIDLPNEMGIYQISYKKSQNYPFVRIPNGFWGLSSGLMIAGFQNRDAFWVENDRIYYSGVDVNKDVVIKLAVSLDSIDDDDPINIPPDIQAMIIDNVLRKYGIEQQTPNDTKNDGRKI